MSEKYQQIMQLCAETEQRVLADAESYMAFLDCAAWQYKYALRDQLLIYAQKPSATACADYKTWNKLGHWINHGTHGISLPVVVGRKSYLRYVFDVSDTNCRGGKEIRLWQARREYAQEIGTELLSEASAPTATLEEVLAAAAKNAAEDAMPIVLQDMEDEGAEIGEQEAASIKELLASCIEYVLKRRCGFEPDKAAYAPRLSDIAVYNKADRADIIAQSVQSQTEMLLRRIAQSIKKISAEKKEVLERSNSHENHIHTGGEHSLSEPSAAAGSEHREIRDTVSGISPEAEAETVRKDADQRDAERASRGDRSERGEDGRSSDPADGREGGRDGGIESAESDAVDRVDEQHSSQSRGAGYAGTDLQLSGRTPGQSFDVDYYAQDDEKNELLRDALKGHHAEIAEFFGKNMLPRERAEFVRSFFDGQSVEKILSNGQRAGYRAYADVLHFWRGTYDAREREEYCSWKTVSSYIEGMIVLDNWLEPEEKPVPDVEEQIALIDGAEQEKKMEFVLPQAAIDYVLRRGSGFVDGQFRIYEHFLLGESTKSNVDFLKKEYGLGGGSDAIPGTDIWENHDGSGIELYRMDESLHYKISWEKVAKRIAQLIKDDRYLNSEEKNDYTDKYLVEKAQKAERKKISEQFIDVVREYNDFLEANGRRAEQLSLYVLCDCEREFTLGKKTTWTKNTDNFVVLLMREAMEQIAADPDAQLRDRAEEILKQLQSPLATALEPKEEELYPAKEAKEYRITVGETVYIGTEELEFLYADDKIVRLFDPSFPIFNREIPTQRFKEQLRENPMNDRLLYPIESSAAKDVLTIPQDENAEPGSTSELAAEVEQIEHERQEKVRAEIEKLTPEQQRIVRAMDVAGFEYDPLGAHTAMEPIVFLSKADGYPMTYKTWEEAYRGVDEAELKETPGLREQVQQVLHAENAEPGSAPVVAASEYDEIKLAHADDIVLYQVGDFFEIYGEDAILAAEKLNVRLVSRVLPNGERTDMCGFPVFQLEERVEELRDKYDVTIAALDPDNGKRIITTQVSIDHEAEREINAYEAEFGADGYRAFPGNAPEQEYGSIDNIDPAELREALAQRGIVNGQLVDPEKLDHDPFVQQVVTDVEQIAAQDFSPKTGYDDAFYIDRDNESVTWMYYNPDSNAGGQYVTNTLSFDEIQQAAREYDSAEDFFDYLGSIANQELADVGTEWFEEAESQFSEQPDFTDCTKATMQSLVTAVSEAPVFDRETEILYSVLGRLKIDDIALSYDENGLVARDSDNEWHGAEFYHFLVDEAFVFEDDGSVLGIRPDLLDDFKALSEHNGVEVKDNREQVQQVLHVENAEPGSVVDRIREKYKVSVLVGFEHDGNYEFYGDDAQTVANILGRKLLNKQLENGESVPVTGFPAGQWAHFGKKIWSHGQNLVLMGEAEDGSHYLVHEYKGKDYLPIGMKLNIEERQFQIDAVDYQTGRVSLRDTTFQNGAGFPIFRSESTEFVRSFVEEQQWDNLELEPVQEQAEPQAETVAYYEGEKNNLPFDVEIRTLRTNAPTPKEKAEAAIVHPEIPDAERRNYRIHSDELGVGTPSQRYQANVRAIRLLKQLESDNRLATSEEQDILAQYVGWGGLADCFDERHSRYGELKALLTDDEYAAAKESTMTAFYTPPVVIRAIYRAFEQMNFKRGNVLEPSCGIGSFMGLVPGSMSESKFFGVELDSISGRIAKQLYQKNSIVVQGFEKTEFPDNFFDAAIGNVPFGQYKIPDRRYDKYNFLIHDYFFARTLDKVRPGGVIAFVTSKGTMDKENPSIRRYIAERAELIGAIRLPNNTFQRAAGTEVTSDIIFLQKRERPVTIEPDWVYLSRDENDIAMNSYFVEHPEMIIGEMREVSGRFGKETVCVAKENEPFEDALLKAVQHIHADIAEYTFEEAEPEHDVSIEADPNVQNFSYTVTDGELYYRINSRMYPANLSKSAEKRARMLVELRDLTRELIFVQTENYSDEEIQHAQRALEGKYDAFVKEFGRINSRANRLAFQKDNGYLLLCSLEIMKDGEFERKADIFTVRTIRPHTPVTHVDTSSEALSVSLGEHAKVDMPYMVELTGKTEQEIFGDLKGVIFLNPQHIHDGDGKEKYLPADEYLSGNVREKLDVARRSAQLYPEDYEENVKALEAVQPQELSASEISARLGSTWIPTEVYDAFIQQILKPPFYMRDLIRTEYSELTGAWSISYKNHDRMNVRANNVYGTDRVNAYEIIEATLNLRPVKVYDYFTDANGKKNAKLNAKETQIAQGKQEQIKAEFVDWIWADADRRRDLSALYNRKFNSTRVRTYDGSHLTFPGMNPEVTLRKHQIDAIAHVIYGGNTLLAHDMGAGKTFEMIASAMKMKQLGLCTKSLVVVPNHLTEQWANEWLRLYPAANILVATEKDFETKNRKKFCARIATGDYDAVIIGHSQLEKIPLSLARQRRFLEQQLDEIVDGIASMKAQKKRFTVKQYERTKKDIQARLEKLNDQSEKDDVVSFEELGIDRLFVDEAHYFKNLAAFSKMQNVGGIAQTEAKKSSDLFMKCRYLDELTNQHGVILATGTPISNTMVELYTFQKYLQYGALKRQGLLNFDAWASTFGETVTAIELAPDGSGYRTKTRFARFFNLPELMTMFREVADIQTEDMLHLPTPKVNNHTVILNPSSFQKQLLAQLSERAEKVHNKTAPPSDNMLVITNDGRKLALDQRLMDDMLPDDEESKSASCAATVYDIWERTADKRLTQMIFCDLSTPHNDGKFNVYDDLKAKLTEKGVPEEEIAYVHDAKTAAQKKQLFDKVRSGKVRIIIGSTQKMGVGTNCQQKLIALHHLDAPWRPSDLQQRTKRIARQGNENPEVDVYTYATRDTFDSYLYQLLEQKQRFASQIMTSKSPVRSAEDIDAAALSYAEIKALTISNPKIKEKMELEVQVQRLKLLKASYLNQHYQLEDEIARDIPARIARYNQSIRGVKADMEHLEQNTKLNEDGFSPMVVNGVEYTDKKEAAEALMKAIEARRSPAPTEIGKYRGMKMQVAYDILNGYILTLTYMRVYRVQIGKSAIGNIQRIENVLADLGTMLQLTQQDLQNAEEQLENAKAEVKKPFAQEEELREKSERLAQLNIELSLNCPENEFAEEETEAIQQDAGVPTQAVKAVQEIKNTRKCI